jgi:hypothetical protein
MKTKQNQPWSYECIARFFKIIWLQGFRICKDNVTRLDEQYRGDIPRF